MSYIQKNKIPSSQKPAVPGISHYLRLVVLEYLPPVILAFMVGVSFSLKLNFNLTLLLGILSVIFLTIGYNSFNAIYDKDVDRINKPHRPIPAHILSEKHVLVISIILFVLSFTFAALINSLFFIFICISIVIAVIYSVKPIYLKKRFLIGILSGNLMYAVLFPLAGWALNPTSHISLSILIILFVFGLGIAVLKDLEDLKGDTQFNIKTLPNVIGKSKTLIFAIACYILSIILIIVSVATNTLPETFLFLILIVVLAILNVFLIRGYKEKGAYVRAFLTGLSILTLFEIIMILLILSGAAL